MSRTGIRGQSPSLCSGFLTLTVQHREVQRHFERKGQGKGFGYRLAHSALTVGAEEVGTVRSRGVGG